MSMKFSILTTVVLQRVLDRIVGNSPLRLIFSCKLTRLVTVIIGVERANGASLNHSVPIRGVIIDEMRLRHFCGSA